MYLLLTATIMIWATITWRVVKAFKREAIVVETTQPHPVVNKPENEVLLLNYDDPFLKDIGYETVSEDDNFSDQFADVYLPDPEPLLGPEFKFKGILKAGKKTYGLLVLAGETVMASAGEIIGGFHIVSITADKIVIRRQGEVMELLPE